MTSDPWAPPSEFEEYRLLRLLGRGGMGVVWLAWDKTLERNVAIKFLAARPSDVIRERFMIEARAVARLHHPNVVTIHRVGEVDGHPYLASEYLQGKSLDELPQPIDLRTGIDVALGLARGLAAAHRRGVLHRDVKPANGFFTDEGVVKLLDFGVAKLIAPDNRRLDTSTPRLRGPREDRHLVAEAETQEIDPGALLQPLPQPPETSERAHPTEAGAIVGTPAYIAPELWRGELPTPQSDVYALGVTLFRLFTGQMPYPRKAGLTELIALVSSSDAPPSRSLRAELPPLLAETIDRCLARLPAGRLASGEAVREVLERVRRQPTPQDLPPGNPYRGLAPFQPEDRRLFFGRDIEVGEVLERLRAEPWVVVAGRSGAGKSSFVRAGVIPAIGDGALRAVGPGTTWRVAVMVPGRQPWRALGLALAGLLAALGEGEEPLLAELRDDPALAGRRLRALAEGTVLFVDQLEELITVSEPGERDLFVETLRGILLFSPVVRVIGTVRSDFVAQFDTLAALRGDFVRALYLLGPLDAQGLHDAVIAPAAAHGVRFENEEDVARLIAAGGEASLPLTQFALARLWELRDQTRAVIPADALARIGGVEGALSRHADDVLDLLPAEPRAAARRILLRLVTTRRTRQRRTAEELLATAPAQARTALEALLHGRLVTTAEVGGETAYEITHEALLTGWKRLGDWLDEEDEARAVRERLDGAAVEWQRLGRPREALWRGRQLGGAELLQEGELPARERDFLAASRRDERTGRTRRILLAAALPSLLVLTIVTVQLIGRLRAEGAAAADLADAAALLARARAAQAEVEARRLAMVALYDLDDTAAGARQRDLLRAAAPEAAQRYDAVIGPINRALGRIAGYPPARRVAADLYAERLRIAERDREPRPGATYRDQLAFFDGEGRYGALFVRTGRLRITSEPTGATVRLAGSVTDAGVTPLDLEPELGSTVVELSAPGRAPARAPVVVARDRPAVVDVALLRPDQIPDGFVYVPGGPFLYGSDDPDLTVLPIIDPPHEVTLPSFLVARHEVTNEDYLAYLRALPEADRKKAMTDILIEKGGTFTLTWFDGQTFAEGARVPIPYRQSGASSAWARWPIFRLSYAQSVAYAAWLASTGKVPGARLCRDREWEKSARGVDGRRYPHGDTLAPGDASWGETDGPEVALTRFPDEVGHYPASRSVYGLDDAIGNAWEWTTGIRGRTTLRSGAWFTIKGFVRAASKSNVPGGGAQVATGLRLCADLPAR